MELLERIARPRPVGSEVNRELTEYIGSCLRDSGYEVKELPFECKVWEGGEAYLRIDGKKLEVQVSAYSEGFSGVGKGIVAGSLDELKAADCKNKLLFLTGELAEESLQPKDYPFYYPDEHKEIIECLEEKMPCAIVAVTGRSSMCGLEPFPVIEDGNFNIPVCSMAKAAFAVIEEAVKGREVEISIVSGNKETTACQLITSKRVPDALGTIVVCAHMDSKYNTDGALDNASGVVTMLLAAQGLEAEKYNIEIVPFNTEEYYDPKGELLYLEELQKEEKEISLLINIDTVAHKGSKVAVATFNFTEREQQKLDELMQTGENVVAGQPWYAGDHTAFAFGGTKCILISASDLFEESIGYTHCPKDTIDLVDENLIKSASAFICKAVKETLS